MYAGGTHLTYEVPEALTILTPTARFRRQHRTALARLAARQTLHLPQNRLTLYALHRDGHEFPVEMALTATDEPTGRLFHAFVQDITTALRVRRFTAVEAAAARGLIEADTGHAAATAVNGSISTRDQAPRRAAAHSRAAHQC